jgi:hypothetical protein
LAYQQVEKASKKFSKRPTRSVRRPSDQTLGRIIRGDPVFVFGSADHPLILFIVPLSFFC